jgi:hypothetical protein
MNDENSGTRLSTADMAAVAHRREEQANKDRESLREQKDSQNPVETEPLFDPQKVEDFRSRWLDIQTRFVDDPKASVRDADELVAQVIQNIAEIFAGERTYMEDQWKQGGEISTEDLRISITRYRSLFNRLLSMGS